MRKKNKLVGRARARIIAAGAALGLTLSLAVPPAANAFVDVVFFDGTIKCNVVPNILIGTQSTARGTTIDHALNHPNGGLWQRTNVGGSSVYSTWGWSFTKQEGGLFTARAHGASSSAADVVNGSLSRFCTFPFA